MSFPSFPRLALLALATLSAGAAELTLVAPARSYLSPVSIEGTMPGALPTVSRYGYLRSPARSLGPQAWYSDVLIVPDLPAVITVTAGAEQRSQTVTWETIDLDGAPLALVARPWQMISLRGVGNRIEVRAPSGITSLAWATPGEPRLFTLRQPGEHRFRRPDGVGGVTVRVYAATVRQNPNQPVAVLVDDSSYVFPLPIAPHSDEVFCTSADPDLIVARSGSGVALRPRTAGTHLGAVRLGSATGPILAVVPVVGYNLDVSKALYPLAVADDGSVPAPDTLTVIGSETSAQRLRARIVMKPWVPNVKLVFTKFAHPATFLGGATTFAVRTDGSPSTLGEAGFVTSLAADGTRIGTFDYTINNPAGNDSQCARLDSRTLFSDVPTGIAWLLDPIAKP